MDVGNNVWVVSSDSTIRPRSAIIKKVTKKTVTVEYLYKTKSTFEMPTVFTLRADGRYIEKGGKAYNFYLN